MSVLNDFSNITVSNISVFWSNRKNPDYVDFLHNKYTREELKDTKRIIKDSLRQMFVASLGKYIRKFSKGFGEIYICQDNKSKGGYWRHYPEMGGFEEYKWMRKHKKPTKDATPWDKLLPIANEIVAEFREVFPYHFINVPYAEGDDAIAVLAKHFALKNEKVKIVSEDKDMVQMQIYDGVEQYSPIRDVDRNFTKQQALEQIHELILTGDTSDGIPNIRSPKDIITIRDPETGKQLTRQKSISKKLKVRVKELNGDIEQAIKDVLPEDEWDLAIERTAQNRKWIGLIDTTPQNIADEILKAAIEPVRGSNTKMMEYLRSHHQCEEHFKNYAMFCVLEDNNPFKNRKKTTEIVDIPDADCSDFFDNM